MSDTFGMLSNMQQSLFAKMTETLSAKMIEMQARNEEVMSKKMQDFLAEREMWKTKCEYLQTDYDKLHIKYASVLEENVKMSGIVSNPVLKGQLLERNFKQWLQNWCIQVNNTNSTHIYEFQDTSKQAGHGDFHLKMKNRFTMNTMFKLIIDTKFEKTPNWSVDVPKIIRDCNDQAGDAYLLVFPNDSLKKHKGMLDFDSECGRDFQRHVQDFNNVDPKMGFACEFEYVKDAIQQLTLKKQEPRKTVSPENYELCISLIGIIKFSEALIKPFLNAFRDKEDLLRWNKLGHTAQQKINRIAASNPDSDCQYSKLIKEQMKNINIVCENRSHSSCFNPNQNTPNKRPRED
jgi:hypothetical protein